MNFERDGGGGGDEMYSFIFNNESSYVLLGYFKKLFFELLQDILIYSQKK